MDLSLNMDSTAQFIAARLACSNARACNGFGFIATIIIASPCLAANARGTDILGQVDLVRAVALRHELNVPPATVATERHTSRTSCTVRSNLAMCSVAQAVAAVGIVAVTAVGRSGTATVEMEPAIYEWANGR